METQNRDSMANKSEGQWNFREPKGSRSGRMFGGLIILTIGLMFLARQLGVDFPYWLTTWPMILIVLGFYVGVRHSFRGPVWIVLLAIGGVFLLDRIDPTVDFQNFIWPVILIAIGLVLIFRPKKKYVEPVGTIENSTVAGEEALDSVTIFGGVKKRIISKSFRGGEVTTIFGGTELDLTQADSPGRIELELTQIFGGTKLIVPPHWRIQSDDLVSIFGGMDDKRPIHSDVNYDNSKVLVLRGTCIFGGIDIKSF
jgi:hypothetical protein